MGTIVCSIAAVAEGNSHSEDSKSDGPVQSYERDMKPSKKIASRLILNLSNQQLLTGIALLIAAQIKSRDISGYHYITTVMLATMSSSLHMNKADLADKLHERTHCKVCTAGSQE
jgi:hypothetical protein